MVTAADKSTDIRIIIGSVVAGVIPLGVYLHRSSKVCDS